MRAAMGIDSARAPLRISAPIPMLVETPHRFGCHVTQSEFAQNVRSPVAAQRNHLFIVVVLGARNMRNVHHAAKGSGVRRDIVP